MLSEQKRGSGVRKVVRAAAVLVLAVGLLWMHSRLREYPYDDAYIHFRIAENLVTEGAPFYNVGEPVKTSSSSAWTLILAGFLTLGSNLGVAVDLSRWVALWNALVTLAGAICYTHLLRRVIGRPVLSLVYIVFFLLYIASVLSASLGLMETATGLLLVGVGLHLLMSGEPTSLVILAVAVFVRPEMVIPFGLALAYSILSRRFGLFSLIFYSVLGLAPFIGYDLYYFGKVMPNAVHAKSMVYTLDYIQAARGTVCAIISCDEVLAYSSAVLNLVYALYIAAMTGVIAKAVINISRNLASRRTIVSKLRLDELGIGFLMGVWGILLCGAYIVAKAFVFGWYTPLFLVPLIFAASVFLALLPLSLYKTLILTFIVPLVLAKLFIVPEAAFAAGVSPVYYEEFLGGARVRNYLRLGEYLYLHHGNAALMTSEIGGLGYTFRGRILDGVGLATPAALAFHPMKVPEERGSGTYGAIPIGFIEQENPELIVSYDVFIEPFLRSDIRREYTQFRCPALLPDDTILSGGGEIWGSRYLNVFIRNDLIVERAAQPQTGAGIEDLSLGEFCLMLE